MRRCGNAVCPPIPAALVKANLPELCVAKHTGNMRIAQEQAGQLRFWKMMVGNLKKMIKNE